MPALLLSVAVMMVMLHSAACSYSKVQYTMSGTPIRGIVNCKVNSNAIFITSDNKINHWVAYEHIYPYDLPYSQAGPQKLVCSKYGSRMDNAYLAVLDSSSRVSIYEEVVKTFSISIDFVTTIWGRQGAIIGDISMGDRYLALAYPNEGLIDVYEIPGLRQVTVRVTDSLMAMSMDFLGNLAVVVQGNETKQFFFEYYESPVNGDPQQYQLVPLSISHYYSSQVRLDYQEEDQKTNYLSYLISSEGQSGTVYYTTAKFISEFTLIGGNSHGFESYCDGQRTFVSSSQNIEKDEDGVIVTVDYPITAYACSTDTGSYVYSQFYIVSSGLGMFYVDCYYSVN